LRVALTCDWFLKYAVEQSAALARAGVDVLLCCRTHASEFGGDGEERSDTVAIARRAGVTVIEVPRRLSDPRGASELLRIRSQIARFRADIVHAHDGADPRVLAVLPRVPLVLTLHDPVPHPGQPMAVARKRWFLLGSRDAWRARADVIVVHSDRLKDETALQGSQRCVVIAHGLTVHGRPLAPPSLPAVGFFGRLAPYKGLDVLARAMPKVWADRPDVQLRVAGAGEAELPLTDERIRVERRYLPEADVARFFSQTSLAVLPYTQASQTGVGSVAVGYGIPIIASRLGGLPDLTLDPSYVCEPGDGDSLAAAIVAHIDDGPEVRDRIMNEVALPRSWDSVARHSIDCYEELLAGRPMKVLFITPGLGAGGAERQTSLLLPGLKRRGVDARIIALDSGGPFVGPLREAGVPVEVLNMRHQGDIGPLVRARLVRDFAPDAIISRGVSGLYVGNALARWRRAAHVYNDHAGTGLELSRRRESMIRLLARRLSAVIVVTPDQSATWLERGCSTKQIVVVTNGVEEPNVPDTRDQIRREIQVAEAAVVALLVASLKPVKRAPDFVRAVLKAREAHPELLGVIVGDGAERAAVEAAAGDDPAIRLLGFRDDIPRLLCAADILVLASEHEAVPMAILEGMAAGLPVLATSVGGIPDLVVDGETGLLVGPGDVTALAKGLIRLSGDRRLRVAMGHAGQVRCRDGWDAETMIDGYQGVLKAVVSARRPQRKQTSRRH
jgi:glycosyltransferase involved in cell wall biosynthesis